MSNIRRVWLVDVGDMPSEKTEAYMEKFIKRIKENEGEDVFIPIRSKSSTRIIELDREVAPGVKMVREHRGFAFKFGTILLQQDADKRIENIKKKIKDGSYTLVDEDGKSQLFIPMTSDMEIVSL